MITVIGNLKGGTGKSTVTFNLAVWLRLTECAATVIDLDPQKTLTDVAALRLEQRIEPPIHVQSGPFPDAGLPGNAEETLIDVGTADIESFKQALRIADRVLIPVTPSQADIWSTQRFVQFLYRITDGNPPESITFINRADTNHAIHASDEAAAALNSLPGVRLIPQRLCDRTVFRDSFSEGLAAFELEPRSRACAELKALASALFGQKRSAAESRPRKKGTPDNVNSFNRHQLEASPVGQTVAEMGEHAEDETIATTEESRDNRGEVEGKKMKHRATKANKAGKGKKRKNRKNGMKDKQAKKGRQDKKNKKAAKAKKGKKTKKGS